jgi:O-antigen/teichoic acid export membrane protein
MYSLVLGFLGFGGLFSFGNPSAILRFSAEFCHSGNLESKYNIYATLVIFLFTILLSLTALIYFEDFILNNLNLNNVNKSELSRMWGTIGVLIFLQELDSIFSNFFRGYGKYRQVSLIDNLSRISLFIFTCLIAILDGSVENLIELQIVITLIKIIYKALSLNRYFKIDFYNFQKLTKENLYISIKYAFWAWNQSIAGVLLSIFDKILVTRFYGLTAVGVYSALLSIAQFLHSVQASALQVFFNKTIASRLSKISDFKKDLFSSLKYSVGTSLLITILFMVFSYPMLNIILGSLLSQEYNIIFIALIFSYGLLSVSILPHYYLLALDANKYVSIINLFAGISTIVISIMVQSYGLVFYSLAKSFYGFILLTHFIYLKIKLTSHRGA